MTADSYERVSRKQQQQMELSNIGVAWGDQNTRRAKYKEKRYEHAVTNVKEDLQGFPFEEWQGIVDEAMKEIKEAKRRETALSSLRDLSTEELETLLQQKG